MIELRNITKSFGPLQVLRGIDLHIGERQVVSIVGPSGAGKTTLLQIMGTLDQPDSGRIVIHGEDVLGFSQKRLHASATSIWDSCSSFISSCRSSQHWRM